MQTAPRVVRHRAGKGNKFCAEYGIDKLVYVEHHEEIGGAIAREKQIKRWRRAWKIEMLELGSPGWRGLFFDLNQ